MIAGASAIGAFLLATARDECARHREGRQKDRTVLTAVDEEVEANLRRAQKNCELIRTELEYLDNSGERILNPLDPLELGFWDLVKLQPPKGLIRGTSAFASVREVARLVAQVNQIMSSREAFRIANPARPNPVDAAELRAFEAWVPALRAYDFLLETFLTELLDALEKVKPAVAAWRRHTYVRPSFERRRDPLGR